MCRFIYTKEESEAIDIAYEYEKKGEEVPEKIKEIVEDVRKRYKETCECR